jgi:hypothetical protein
MDPTWKDTLEEAAVSGSAAAVLSTAALALAGARQAPSAAAPLNATSQWLWGQREALDADEPDRRHTLNGYLIHHFAASFWAVLHARVLRDRPALARPGPALAAAAATSAIAAFVDLKLTPERFTPGFQHRVSTPALVGAYACFAAGLALGSMAMHRRRGQRLEQARTDG